MTCEQNEEVIEREVPTGIVEQGKERGSNRASSEAARSFPCQTWDQQFRGCREKARGEFVRLGLFRQGLTESLSQTL